ncbi:PKD domain-containing protein [Epidermidibacterium keratini]|uniref:PKD domain-containing protein n=1 Tax=Epidermidibacterium keratini TaxID=1891644 RepID=UPI001CEF61C7|nr:PKD domain-containing protein [Epidermidibacterium keratini]
MAVAVAVAALFGVLTVAPSPPAYADTAPPAGSGAPPTVSSDPLPTVQINGIVWAQAASSTTVYAGGEFSSARPAGAAPGTNETPRSNLLSYDLATGVLNSGWNPQLNGKVLATALSPDGSRLYVGGGFTTVNGQNRYRLAAFDTATGQLIASWAPSANTVVQGIAATDTTVYVVGEFSNINGVARSGVAALSASNGSLLSFSATLTGGYGARAVVVSPDKSKIVIAGSFTSTNGQTNPGRGMAALDAVTGASLPWAVNGVLRNAGTNAAMFSLATDGTSVYGTGYDYSSKDAQNGFEGSFKASWSDGSMAWMEDCHGDSYSIAPFDGAVYKAGHAHYCGNIGEFGEVKPTRYNFSLAFDQNPSGTTITPDTEGYRSFTGNPAGKLLDWYPEWGPGSVSGSGQAGWSVVTSGNYVLYGGEFVSINGVKQQGLVRFAKAEVAPNKQGPRIQGGAYQISVAAYRAGQVRISWPANYDTDNAQLTYEVLRRDLAQPIYSTTAESTFYVRPQMTTVDSSVKAGQTYQYRVRVTDPFGNSTVSDWTSVTASGTVVSNTYMDAVLADSPTAYWPLAEPSGTAVYDWAGADDLTITGTATRGSTGHVPGQPSSSTTFSGSSSYAAGKVPRPAPNTFSVEAWFKTTSTTGGKVVGYGNSNTSNSTSNDRSIYLNGSGQVTFGVYPGQTRTISSGSGYNNGKWHHVVGTLGPSGMTMYIDGVRVGSRTDTTSGQKYSGYWRIGGDTVSGWPNAGAAYLKGSIADVAVYGAVLDATKVQQHYKTGSTEVANQPPTAKVSAAANGLSVTVDGSSSSDPDGSIASYAWDFGDGQTGTGATATHTYAAAGTYTITLTVTDNAGATATANTSVTVTAPPPNQAPTAKFTFSTQGLTAAVDGSTSSDPDGSIASYAWDFGDGQTGTGATATHTYTAAGTYTITLTVTDNAGATATATGSVTVSAPPAPTVLASDLFDRMLQNDWGTADLGGPWSIYGGSAAFAVANGAGTVTVAPADTREARLTGVSATSCVVETSFSSDSAAAGGATSVTVIGRRVGTNTYSARVRFEPNGVVRLYLLRDETALGGASYVLPTTYQPGQQLRLKLSVTGTSPTSLAAKVWVDGQAEPASWQLQATDTTAALQAAGTSGIKVSASSLSTVPVTRISFGDYTVSGS